MPNVFKPRKIKVSSKPSKVKGPRKIKVAQKPNPLPYHDKTGGRPCARAIARRDCPMGHHYR